MHKTPSRANRHFRFSPTLLILCFASLIGSAQAQTRMDWPQTQPVQPVQADPTLVRPSGFSIQQPIPQNPNAPQPIVQPNGQRVFNTQQNSNAPFSNQGLANSDTKSAVQPASWNSESPATTNLTPSKAKSRAPLELRTSAKDSVGNVDKPTSSWSAALSMFLSLAVVLSFFLLVAWMVKKSQPNAFIKLPADVVQVMGRTPMAPRQQMYVVRFGSKLLLISHQPGQTQTLGEITDSDEVQRLAGLCEANLPGSITNSFRDVLKQVTSGKSDPEAKSTLRLSRGR